MERSVVSFKAPTLKVPMLKLELEPELEEVLLGFVPP